jgi:hypothetical protein
MLSSGEDQVLASRTNKMVLAFFDEQGVVYTSYIPRGRAVKADCIVGALHRFSEGSLAEMAPLGLRGELVPPLRPRASTHNAVSADVPDKELFS